MKLFLSSAPGVMLILLSNINSALAAPAPAPTTSVTYNNVTYNLSTSYQSYTGNPGVLTSQPWWGDPVLAAGLSNLVQYGLGDYGGQYPASSQTVISAPFAYGLGDRGVAAAYWEADQVVSCVKETLKNSLLMRKSRHSSNGAAV